MKKKSRTEIYAGIARGVKAINAGSVPSKKQTFRTTPMFTITDPKSEAEVLRDCLTWCKHNRLVADRMNVGAGSLGESGYRTYGIKGAGDIIGLLHNGRHFEIECKSGKGGVWSDAQQKRREKIVNSNGLYVVVHSVEELEMLMRIYL